MDHGIILFDGVCNFCNSAVNYVIRHDRRGYFHFAPLQSATAKDLAAKYGFSTDDMNTFILIEHGKVYTKSTAALQVAAKLNFPVRLLYIFIVVPSFIRDRIYDVVARNRYRWAGKNPVCMVPTAAVKGRFMN
ncbi:thiol-disulfide oxidoreductase DCC family protein [Chitinophaga sp. Cy-1792]|uniref:thiol-disulfide oxidoreductase DCC family protein n=1 Tax=Chitinophaga sp. Cy-1792 TaxID=2608339 RepID=UPI0019666E6B|nr:thiol-disulfide oxidoreductase DCC family protein [Chitinophaga sp. Cy-1792]